MRMLTLIALFARLAASDTLDVPTLPVAPVVDGRIAPNEYGVPNVRLTTGAGEVRVWIARANGWLHVAAQLTDTSFYWGDDFVVSLDPDGTGGSAPSAGDRQWYLRRTLDSSVVATSPGGRWTAPGDDRSLGAARSGADWSVASSTDATGWRIELRVRESAARTGTALPRLALRTYDDAPRGWWSWPAPPTGTPSQRVERTPDAWVALRWR